MQQMNPASARVVAEITKAPDLRAHVRVVEVEGMRVVEIRDYIPSLGEYGRGYWVPLTEAAVYGILSGLQEVAGTEDLA